MEQSNIGIPEFKIANLFEDIEILKEAQGIATRIMEEDPELKLDKNQRLLKQVENKFKERIEI